MLGTTIMQGTVKVKKKKKRVAVETPTVSLRKFMNRVDESLTTRRTKLLFVTNELSSFVILPN